MRKEKMLQLLRCLLAVLMVLSLLGCRSDGAASAQTDDTGQQLQATGTEPEETIPEDTEPSETTKPSEVTDPSQEATVSIETTEATEPEETKPVQTDPPATEPQPTSAPHSHSYTAAGTVAPGCESQGYTTYKCSCGSSYKDSYTAALGHSYSSAVVAATYEAGGYTQHTCTRCGSSYTSDPTPKLEAAPLDYAVAEAYGNQYAASTYGFIIEASLDVNNAGYYPAGTTRVEICHERGGQEYLNKKAKDMVDALYEVLMSSDGTIDGMRVNCGVYEDNGKIYIYVFYG